MDTTIHGTPLPGEGIGNKPVKPLKELPNGLQNIALSFSGGGFRAAAFCLGCFSYLEHITINDKKLSTLVKFISSASGGSFASMAIVYAQRQGQVFNAAYKNLFEGLNGSNLLNTLHEILKTDDIWQTQRPDKDRNFVNAIAIAHDKMLFGNKTFSIFCNPAPPGTVEEICVNVTDITHGQQFRFQHNGNPAANRYFGSHFLNLKEVENEDDNGPEDNIDHDVPDTDPLMVAESEHWSSIKKIKLGDILAASSCFPAGFEPIMYPNDFAWHDTDPRKALTVAALSEALETKDSFINKQDNEPGDLPVAKTFGFMDGGIVDNQGIDAFQLAEGRLQSKQKKLLRTQLQEELKAYLATMKDATGAEKDAIKLAYKEKKAQVTGHGYDLFAACDVSSNYTDGFAYPKTNKTNWWLRRSVIGYVAGVLLLLVTGIFIGFAGICTHTWLAASYILTGATGLPLAIIAIPLVLSLLKKFFRFIFGKRTPKASGNFKKLFGPHIMYFLRLPLGRSINLLVARASSLVNVALVLFLKKIRQESYEAHMKSGFSTKSTTAFTKAMVAKGIMSVTNKTALEQFLNEQKSWSSQTINPTVYMLGSKNAPNLLRDLKNDRWYSHNTMVGPQGSQKPLKEVLLPSAAVQAVSDTGTSMPTTLWFDSNHEAKKMLAVLIAGGQLSMCHCLLRFAHRFNDNSKGWQQMKDDLLEHWQKFQQNPYWMYNELGQQFADKGEPLEGFSEVHN